MKEIGGFIEFETFSGKMLHEDGIKLNCGRNALAYIVKAKKIKKIMMPKYICDSCIKVLEDNGVEILYYSIGLDFKPIFTERDERIWLYVVNYYGQLSNEYLQSLGKNIIVDNAHAYFQEPIKGVDTIYTCRKFFGVSDGAILYTDTFLDEELDQDESYSRMGFLLGRYERTASEFYDEYVKNNDFFRNEPIKKMSKLTENILKGLDYDEIKVRRSKNFELFNERFEKRNKLIIKPVEGAYMYPLYICDAEKIKEYLRKNRIYIPTLWPSVLGKSDSSETAYELSKHILPLPVDQRYNAVDMNTIIRVIEGCQNG